MEEGGEYLYIKADILQWCKTQFTLKVSKVEFYCSLWKRKQEWKFLKNFKKCKNKTEHNVKFYS